MNKKKIRTVLLFILIYLSKILSACADDNQAMNPERLFFNKLLALWPSAMNIEKLNPRSIGSGVPLTRPPLTWWPLLRVEGIGFDGVPYAHCMYYLIPRHENQDMIEQAGLLKVVSVGMEENCQDKFVRTSFAFLEGVEQLIVYVTAPGSQDNLGHDLASNQFILKFFYQGKEVNWTIPFYNIPTENLKEFSSTRLVDQWDLRVANIQAQRYRAGVQLAPILNAGKTIQAQAKWFGQSMEKAESMCLVLDDQCHQIGPDMCQQCATFPQSANAYKCASSFNRFCGKGRCGERNMPACPRGQHYMSTELSETGIPNKTLTDVCNAGVRSGICRPGLNPFCNEHGVQICL